MALTNWEAEVLANLMAIASSPGSLPSVRGQISRPASNPDAFVNAAWVSIGMTQDWAIGCDCSGSQIKILSTGWYAVYANAYQTGAAGSNTSWLEYCYVLTGETGQYLFVQQGSQLGAGSYFGIHYLNVNDIVKVVHYSNSQPYGGAGQAFGRCGIYSLPVWN